MKQDQTNVKIQQQLQALEEENRRLQKAMHQQKKSRKFFSLAAAITLVAGFLVSCNYIDEGFAGRFGTAIFGTDTFGE